MRIVKLRDSVRSLVLGGRRNRRAEESTAGLPMGEAAEALADLAACADGLKSEDAAHQHSQPANETVADVSIDYEAARSAFDAGDFAKAIFILERLPMTEHEQGTEPELNAHLLLNVCRCQAGRKAEAVVDLYAWERDEKTADTGRVLLSLLLNAEGDTQTAQRILTNDSSETMHASSTALAQVLALLNRGEVPEARRLARQMMSHRGELQRLGLLEETNADFDETANLGDEITENETILKSLSAGLICGGQRSDLLLLARGIERALPRLHEPVIGIECLGDLYHSAGRAREARLWILRGIRDYPASTCLQELLLRLPDETITVISANSPEPAPAEDAVVVPSIRKNTSSGISQPKHGRVA